MHRLHLTRNLRTLAFLLVAIAMVAALATLWWANHTGLPESWRAAIEREISKQGVHVKIGRLSYVPMRGVIASKVRVFSDPNHQHEISRLASVILNFDKTKLARNKIHITKVELKDADLTLPVDPRDPTSPNIEVSGVNGTLVMPGNRRFEIRNARGRVAGIDISLDARLIGYQQQGKTPNEPTRIAQRREFLIHVIEELKHWHFSTHQPPELRAYVEFNANDSSSFNATLALHANDVGKNLHILKKVSAEAKITGDLITFTSITASDTRGSLDGHLDYDLGDRAGRFDLRSSLEIPRLLEAWIGLPPMPHVSIGGNQTLEAAGDFRLDDQYHPEIHVTGRARCDSVRARGVQFDSVQGAFAWRDGDLFLRDLRVTHTAGEARGKAMVQGPLVRLAVESTLPLEVYRPFVVKHPLERVLNDFSERKGATAWVSLEGGFDTSDPKSWAYSGAAKTTHVNYRGVPVNSAECRLSLSHHELDFLDGTVVFNYQNYPLREAFNGPAQGTVKVGRVRFDAPAATVEIEEVAGAIWAAPVVRLFAPKLADSLEIYRFHRPPELRASGVVDVTPQGRTSLNIDFNSGAAADYRFLGENLTLDKPSGKVIIRGGQVTVDDLNVTAFEGPVTARFEVNGKDKLAGELYWTRLSIPALTSAYGFQIKGGGQLTGRLEFALNEGRVETMSGDGLFALEKTELFSVPMFGPLSSVVSGVLNDRRAGFEHARSAFCTFQIKEGMLSTRDFQTQTTSLSFMGDGVVDLKERTLDFIMRMNARGLLGLITLPLRPFYGMFQFRGTGPLKKPKWENVMFTAPPEEQKSLLLPTPKALSLPTPKARVLTGRE